MSVSLGPLLVMVNVVIGSAIGPEVGIGSRGGIAVGGVVGLVLWIAIASRTGRPLVTYGYGVDHMGTPDKTFRALWTDIWGDDDE